MKAKVILILIRTFVRLVSWLPLSTARRLASGLGSIVWRLPTQMRKVTETNLALCFPQLSSAEREQLGKQSVKETLKIGFEYGVIWYWSLPRWRSLVTHVSGWDQVEAAMAQGSGILLLVPHIGNWEMMNIFLSEHTRFMALFDPPKHSSVAEGLFAARERVGTDLQPIGMAGLRNVYKALSSQRIVLVLPDQVPERRAGVYAPFFNQPALTMSFGLRILHKNDAKVFCAVVKRVDKGFEIAFETFSDDIYATDLATQAAAMNAGIEAAIKKAPAQYQWEYKRFKRQPEGVADPYKH